MDGVLADTQKFHSEAERQVLAPYVTLSAEEIEHRYAGVPCRTFFAELVPDPRVSIDALVDKKWRLVFEMTRNAVRPIPGALELLTEIYKHQQPLAVASGSSSSYMRMVLGAIGAYHLFAAVVSADMVAHGKPSPDVFLYAAGRINVHPRDCLVVEDGIAGMKAARAAGMFCYGLVKDRTAVVPADKTVLSLVEITAEHFEK